MPVINVEVPRASARERFAHIGVGCPVKPGNDEKDFALHERFLAPE